MSIKANVLYALQHARKNTESLIETIDAQNQWMFQVHPKTNHPMWVVGHLALADNMIVSKFSPESDSKPDGWDELFWFGSEVHSDASKYPPPSEVLGYFRERREKLLSIIEGLTDEVLSAPTPDEGMFADAPNMAQPLIFAAWHEGLHFGQATMVHRAMGHAPLFQPNAESAN